MSGGTIGDTFPRMTTYLPDVLRRTAETEARRLGTFEAEVVRRAVAAATMQSRPRVGMVEAEPLAGHADELLAGFGLR
jgi:hypothetical protein